ncbi:phosphotyrosine protein phosphatase [Candidatus Woesearchaeota archaeon]|nr:phosphotyrosine protein phosphatase [Candidatus Woesearchaeota archaeon]
MKVLFICNLGMNRSRTAAELFKDQFETKCAGLYSNIVKKEELELADLIVVMEESQRKELEKRFSQICRKKKIICLDILDVYLYNDPKLIKILETKKDLIR